tara:strand:+ start:3294 stop:4571 length:1278 start_codon:yes stop_codon:yes gene_type:complete
MVSFDAATMFGTKFEDMGTWEPVFHEEFDELKDTAPEVWLFEVDENHFIEADERRFDARLKSGNLRMRESFWERQRTLSLPRLTDKRRQVSRYNQPRINVRPTKFVALTQPNSREVLLLVPTKFYWDAHFHESKTVSEKSKPPFYLQIIVDEMVLKSFLDIRSCEISVLTEIRDFGYQLPEIKLLNWMDSSSLLDYVDVAPNPLRPFLWYLELKPFLSPDKRDYDGSGSFGGFKRVIQRPYGFYNPYLDNSDYGLLPTTVENLYTGYIPSKVPSKAWEQRQGSRKSINQWVGDDPKYQAETFNSENLYEIMMAHDYTTLPKRGLCPICDGAIPNNETPGAYPGALSRFDNETEVCSACGSAEALTPMFSEEGKDLMVAGIQNDEWDWWKAGVLMGREPVDEMMEASKKAQEIMKEKGFTEGKPGD